MILTLIIVIVKFILCYIIVDNLKNHSILYALSHSPFLYKVLSPFLLLSPSKTLLLKYLNPKTTFLYNNIPSNTSKINLNFFSKIP